MSSVYRTMVIMRLAFVFDILICHWVKHFY